MVFLNRDALTEKVLAGERISTNEGLELYRWPLEELGILATARRDLAKAKSYNARGSEIVTYIVDRNINYTNICNVYCKFCAFYRTEKDEDHYVLSFEQIDQKLDELSAAGGVQILMQGGHHPKLPFQWYVDLLHHIRERYPHINIHGFSPPEFQHFAETFRMSLREVISEFKNAGLGSIPGGGGEILVDRVRKKISPLKINSDQWLEVMQVAHELGLRSSATMMIGARVSAPATVRRRGGARLGARSRRSHTAIGPSRSARAARAVSATASGCCRSKASCAAVA